ncbi:hypothetical protein B0J17DRAFT_713885 [Rhizoctonia solani]|nr:hypothetical protein B0J17DRAFT_713885 [Rhizoctonia solani]
MKSLVALLDRKKKDRANTLVQVPFPSSLPHSAVHRDGLTSIHGARRTSTPSSFLRLPQQPRAAPDTGHMHRPLLSEPSACYPGHSSAQSASYYTDSDDGTFVDPFAPSPTKLDLASKPHYETPPQGYPGRGSEPNSTSTFGPSSYRFRPPQEPRGPSVADESKSQPILAAPASKKGRWLRERRSLTSLLRPQQSKSPVEPVPIVPSLPYRVPERKPSLFFTRSRSGSTPLATQRTELAHTILKPSIGLESVQLPTSANAQPPAVGGESKNGISYRGSVPLTLMSHSQANSPDSWVRVEGTSRDPGLPTSPTTRRRAISVPLPLQPTELPPSVPNVQRIHHAQKPKVDRSNTTLEPMLMRRPGTSTDFHTRRSHNAHGIKSASVSVPASTKSNASAGTVLGEQEQLISHHNKQSSAGTMEGLVLKSALKHRLVESIQSPPDLPVQSVKPLRICKREGVPSKVDSPQLPTPSSEGSLKAFHHASIGHVDGAQATAKHHKGTSGSSSREECLDTVGGPVTSSTTAGSFTNIMKGHGLPSSDSRLLPVLDNIWGSFVSETAFGSSLPPSPITSISARYRTTQSQETNSREQIGHDPMDLESGSSASCSSHSESHWKPGSAPLSSPPVTTLPPVPKPPPTLASLLGRGTRRKRSGSSANAINLLTPPTSPTEEMQSQGLDRVITSSTYSDNPLSRSGAKCSASRQQLGPRLARSASSPSIRPSLSPEIVCNPIKMRGPASDALSRLSVQHQKFRSISPSSASQSSSQCTPVPGTPVALPPSAVNHAVSYLGTSSGPLASGPSVRMPRPREGGGYAESSEGSVMGIGIQASGTVSRGVSDAIMGEFPPVPSNQIWPYQEEKSIGAMINHDATEGDPREEPLLTPPVTPAWAVHVFDAETEDNLQLSRMEYDASGDRIPLARSGNLAQMRRHKRGDMRSSSTQFPSRGPDLPPRNSEKTDIRRNKASNNATFPARHVL